MEEVASELEQLITACVKEVFGRFPAAHAVVNGRVLGLYQDLLEVRPADVAGQSWPHLPLWLIWVLLTPAQILHTSTCL
jgi:hypothetical protein